MKLIKKKNTHSNVLCFHLLLLLSRVSNMKPLLVLRYTGEQVHQKVEGFFEKGPKRRPGSLNRSKHNIRSLWDRLCLGELLVINECSQGVAARTQQNVQQSLLVLFVGNPFLLERQTKKRLHLERHKSNHYANTPEASYKLERRNSCPTGAPAEP